MCLCECVGRVCVCVLVMCVKGEIEREVFFKKGLQNNQPTSSERFSVTRTIFPSTTKRCVFFSPSCKASLYILD